MSTLKENTRAQSPNDQPNDWLELIAHLGDQHLFSGKYLPRS